jgi:hypothetical protein
VARRNRQPFQTREIRIAFEPSRLSPSWVAQAYEQIVPIVRRPTSSSSRSSREGSASHDTDSREWAAAFAE